MNRLSKVNWLFACLLSAASRLFETASLVLPIKLVFLLMKPELLDEFTNIRHVSSLQLVLVGSGVVVLFFLLSRLLNALARRKVRRLQHSIDTADNEELAQSTMKILSAMVVMLIYASIIAFFNIYVFILLVVLLVPNQLLHKHFQRDDKKPSRVVRLLGLNSFNSSVRFVNQATFLAYFILTLLFSVLLELEIGVMLLLSLLIGRRLFQEFNRFQNGLAERENALNPNNKKKVSHSDG